MNEVDIVMMKFLNTLITEEEALQKLGNLLGKTSDEKVMDQIHKCISKVIGIPEELEDHNADQE
jgi:hypothetical protein